MKDIHALRVVRARTICLIGLIGIISLVSVQAAPPPSSFGVWDRGSSFDPKDHPFLKGLAVNEKWADVEKRPGIFDSEGDTDHIRREFGKSEVNFINGVEARSLFSLDYLKDMGKVMSRAAEVEVSLGMDHPAKFSFFIAMGNGHVEYLLAPRIEAD